MTPENIQGSLWIHPLLKGESGLILKQETFWNWVSIFQFIWHDSKLKNNFKSFWEKLLKKLSMSW